MRRPCTTSSRPRRGRASPFPSCAPGSAATGSSAQPGRAARLPPVRRRERRSRVRAMRALVDDGWSPSAAAAAILVRQVAVRGRHRGLARPRRARDGSAARRPRARCARRGRGAPRSWRPRSLDAGGARAVLDDLFSRGSFERVARTCSSRRSRPPGRRVGEWRGQRGRRAPRERRGAAPAGARARTAAGTAAAARPADRRRACRRAPARARGAGVCGRGPARRLARGLPRARTFRSTTGSAPRRGRERRRSAWSRPGIARRRSRSRGRSGGAPGPRGRLRRRAPRREAPGVARDCRRRCPRLGRRPPGRARRAAGLSAAHGASPRA